MRACPGLASRHRVVVMFAGCATSVLALYTMDIVGCGAIVVQSIYISVCGFSTFSCWIMCATFGVVCVESLPFLVAPA